MKRKEREDASVRVEPDSPASATGEGWLTPEPVADALAIPEEHRALEERLARLAAEFSNSRRRLEREGEAKVERAVDDFLRRVLSIVDHLDLALGSAGDGGRSFVEGVRLIRAEIRELLASEGVREIEARAKPFDPKYHEALAHEARTECPPGTVFDEVRRGYTRRDRVLRPAQVRVSRAPESPPAASPQPPKENPPDTR